jgi:hypothetical protein
MREFKEFKEFKEFNEFQLTTSSQNVTAPSGARWRGMPTRYARSARICE